MLSEEIKNRLYNIEVGNRFQALGDIEDLEEEHDMTLEAYREARKNTTGETKNQSKP